jgi:uncharacterized protein
MNPVIDTFAFARTGACQEFSVPLAKLARFSTSVLSPASEARVHCQGGADERGRPGLRLQVRARYEVRCDRCGLPLEREADIDRDFYFVRSDEELGRIAVDPLEESDPLVGSDRFALLDLVEEELLLDLPISPRHEACEPVEGTGFQPGAGPEEPARENPFAALQKIRRNS